MSTPGGLLPAADRHRALAIVNVTVHTMDARGTLSGQTVVIEDARVSRIDRVGEVPTEGSDVVDGTDRYLMPGLTDMHAHLFAPTDLNLYLATGVTLVRDLGPRGRSEQITRCHERRRGQRTRGVMPSRWPPPARCSTDATASRAR